MVLQLRCLQCQCLEDAHDEAMENYIRIVEEQALLFRKSQTMAARALDDEIHRLKALRQMWLDELIQHQSDHMAHTRVRNGGHDWLKA